MPNVERGVTQARVGWDMELLRPTRDAGLLRPASEVLVVLWTQGLRFSQNVTFMLKLGSHLMTCPW